MIHDLGNLSFDEELCRYVYEENWGCDGDPLSAWMIGALFDPYGTETPDLITEVRFSERKHDPLAMETKVEQIVILGLSESSEYDQMRSPDLLNNDEIKIQIEMGLMGNDLKIILVEEAVQSIQLLTSLHLFVEQEKRAKAA